MPSKTPKQARTMAMVAHNSAMAKKVGIPAKVAKDFNAADKGTGMLAAKPMPKGGAHPHSNLGKFLHPKKR